MVADQHMKQTRRKKFKKARRNRLILNFKDRSLGTLEAELVTCSKLNKYLTRMVPVAD